MKARAIEQPMSAPFIVELFRQMVRTALLSELAEKVLQAADFVGFKVSAASTGVGS